jgi:lysophospholipase L1-like esterase
MSDYNLRFPRIGLAALVGFLAAAGPAGAEPATSFAFDFGSGAAQAGYVKVLPGAVYSKEVGYGFDLGTAPASFASGVTSEKPFFFSVAVPEGNYNIAVTFGDAAGACVSTVKAESRRLMLEEVATAAGKFETRTFVVNVRNVRIPPPPRNAPGGDQVRLNDREQGVLHWDDKLTLEFSNTRPCVDSMRIDKVDNIPTVFITGDSTVTDQPREPTASWGQMLTRFFKPGVAIANHAESGETLKSFITGLRLDKILSQMKKGDYLFMQFGHNDQKANWPQTYVEPFTTHKQYLKVFIAEARRRGAIPVLVTPMQRRSFDDQGKIRNTLGDFPESVRQTAKEENVALIDLTAMSIKFYEALGPDKSPLAFSGGRDATHHSDYGAYELAKCIVEGIKANRLDLTNYIVDDYKTFDPAHPDPPEAFKLPASPGRSNVPPRGQ